jgi:uncharacterized protein DUF2795
VSPAKPGNHKSVLADVATLQGLLEGIDLPASKSDLISYAREQDDGTSAARLLERLPDREFRSLDDVGEALAPVQPKSSTDERQPKPESDQPPGGDDYVNPDPETGTVRDDAPPDNPPAKAIEEQTQTQNEQKERQEKHLGREG